MHAHFVKFEFHELFKLQKMSSADFFVDKKILSF